MTASGPDQHYAVYPANLCLLLFGGEFAKFGSNLGEAVYYAVEYGRSGVSFRQGAPKHLEDMLGGLDRVKAAGKVGEERCGGGFRRRGSVARRRTELVKLAVDVIGREFGVIHGHLRGGMTKELHECGKADPRSEHFGRVGVAKHVRGNASFDSQRGSHLK